MKKLAILSILIILLCNFLSCKDEDKDKFKFIEKLLSSPDKYEIIIKESKYYRKDGHNNFFWKNYQKAIVNHIRKYFQSGYGSFTESRDQIDYDVDGKKYTDTCHDIKIYCKNDIDVFIWFRFVKVYGEWVLGQIKIGPYLIMILPRKDYEIF